MKTTSNSLNIVALKRIVVIPMFLFFTITLSFSQETKQNGKVMNFENEWWYPILIKHKVKPTTFNNFKNIFEMGETNSTNNGICTLTNAFVIIRDSTDNYSIIESPLLYHDFNKELIITNAGTLKKYKKNSDSLVPIEVWKIDKMELHVVKN